MSRPIFLSPPDVGAAERAALLAAFDGGWIAPVGPELNTFEVEAARVAGVEHAVALVSGTAALHLALLESGVGPGDSVVVPTLTFAATVNAVYYCGATPVLVDVDPSTWNLSPTLLRAELEARARLGTLPRAVVTVDLYGQCADYQAILPMCEEFGVVAIEDAAEAAGSTGPGGPAGSFGRAGVFSFNGNKIATCGGGGMLVTDDGALAARVRHLATQARQPVAHYEHREIGYNYRLSNLLAAVGVVQLRRLPEMMERRAEIHRTYRELLAGSGIDFMPITPGPRWNAWLTCVQFGSPAMAEHVRLALAAEDIESRPVWKPMHLQPAFAGAPGSIDGTAERLYRHGLCLPSGSGLTDADVERIAGIVVDTVASSGRGIRSEEAGV